MLCGNAFATELPDEQADLAGTDSLVQELPSDVQNALSDISPTESTDFWGKFKSIFFDALGGSDGALKSGLALCASLLGIMMLCAIVNVQPTKDITGATNIAGALAICAACIASFHSTINLAMDMVRSLTDYSTFLLPAMASATAMSGGLTSASALYAGTVLFSNILMQLISKLLLPVIYFYLAVATAEAAMANDMLTQLREFIGWLISKSLRIILYIFTAYMTLTGVISGTADATSVRTMKAAVSTMVPVVGSILSDSSDTLLAGAALLKNSIGIFGMIAVIALCITPFLRVGIQYILLKTTSAVSGIVGMKSHVSLMKNFSAAMGYLLGMCGACVLMLLISMVCFLRVVV
jgi:stage III sporulation protein AE